MTISFDNNIRNSAISTTCSNLIMAGVLLTQETAQYMATISDYSDLELARVLVESRALLDKYYENAFSKN